MNDLVKRLEELTCEHRELIKELSYENQRLDRPVWFGICPTQNT